MVTVKEMEGDDDGNNENSIKMVTKKEMEGSDSSVSTQEHGSRNKRKFLSEFPLDMPVESPALSLTEFPRYEFLEEKLHNTLSEFVPLDLQPDQANEKHEMESSQQGDWDEPVACELEKLLINNLHATFRTAIKKIVECGYSQELAELVVLRSGLYHGVKDAVSNVVDGALSLLTKERYLGTRYQVFEEFDSLVEYAILEMICVLREVKPFLTVAEAMWYLLICDMNLLHACAVKGDPSCEFFSQVNPGESSSDTKVLELKTEVSKASSNHDKSHLSKSSTPTSQSVQTKAVPSASQLPKNSRFRGVAITGKDGSVSLLEMEKSLGATVSEEKSGAGRKGSSLHSKKDILRQKAFHFEKTYKGRVGKGGASFKAKFTSWGSMVLDKTMNAQAGSSSTATKVTYSKISATAKATGLSAEGNQHATKNSALLISENDTVGVPPVQDTIFALPAVNSKTQSPSDQVSMQSPKSPGNISTSSSVENYYTGIPYDESLGKYVPQDEKDKTILMLIPHIQKLEKEIQGWTDWATEKVKQTARRLGKDQAELRMLRQEKEDAEKFQKDKQALEENTLKRLTEMEYALSNASGQMEMANSSLHRLEAEHAVLKKKMEAAKLHSLECSRNVQEAMVREQEALKKCQAWEVEKNLLQEEFTALKCEGANFQQQLEKAKKRLNQIEALRKQEEKEKEKLVRQAKFLQGEREQLGALAKIEEDNIREMAEKEMQKRKNDIDKLASKISELRLESEASKIEALRRGIGTGHGKDGPNSPMMREGQGGVKPERECVMCLTEEISVVFVPCAHQVLCSECNVLHEKQGMKDCPSCRTLIKTRINVRYSRPS